MKTIRITSVAGSMLTWFGCNFAFGQNLPPLQADRPDQTESPSTVPEHHFQIETGLNFEHADENSESFVLPSTLWKYGLNDHFELRLITEYTSVKSNHTTLSGLNPITLGFKTNLVKEKGFVPVVSFIGHLTIPGLASDKLKSTYYAPAFRFTMQHTLSENISIGYNLGAEWDGESAEPAFIYTLTTGFSLSKKTGGYVELYSFLPQKGKPDHRCDAGITYLLDPNFMVDISGGLGMTRNAPQYYGSFGFTWRF